MIADLLRAKELRWSKDEPEGPVHIEQFGDMEKGTENNNDENTASSGIKK